MEGRPRESLAYHPAGRPHRGARGLPHGHGPVLPVAERLGLLRLVANGGLPGSRVPVGLVLAAPATLTRSARGDAAAALDGARPTGLEPGRSPSQRGGPAGFR